MNICSHLQVNDNSLQLKMLPSLQNLLWFWLSNYAYIFRGLTSTLHLTIRIVSLRMEEWMDGKRHSGWVWWVWVSIHPSHPQSIASHIRLYNNDLVQRKRYVSINYRSMHKYKRTCFTNKINQVNAVLGQLVQVRLRMSE